MKSLDKLTEEIDLNRLDCSSEVDHWAGEQLASLRSEIIRFERDDAYQRFIRRHIDTYTPGEHDEKPPCTCGNDCPIINGRLPAMIQEADDPGRAQEDWALRHPGTPHALLTADESYREELAGLYNDLYRIRTATDRDTIPTADQDEEAGDEVAEAHV